MVNKLAKSALSKAKAPARQPATKTIAPPKGRPLEEVSAVKSSPKGKSGMDSEREWKAKDALSTLTRAEEIRRDKQLMKDVQAHAVKHKASIDQALSGVVKRKSR